MYESDEIAAELAGRDLPPLTAAAEQNLAQEIHLINHLRNLRLSHDLTVADVARDTGWEEDKVRDFESGVYDPYLSEVRLYAMVVEALVVHNLD